MVNRPEILACPANLIRTLQRYIVMPALLASFLLSAWGCSAQVTIPEAYWASDSEATIIFQRTEYLLGCAIPAALFDVTDQETVFLGRIHCRSQLAYKTVPGEHLFMIAGSSGSADFLRAKFVAGNTYYAIVVGRPSPFRLAFSLNPVEKHENHQKKFQKNRNTLMFVESTPEIYAWADKNAESFEKRRTANMPRWIERYGTDTFALTPEDGI